MNYKYENPINNGYIKIKLSKDEMKEFNIKRKWNLRHEFYKKDNHILVHEFVSVKGIVLSIAISPIIVTLNTLCKFFEVVYDCIEEIYKMIFSKKTGSFVSSRRFVDKNKMDEIEDILNNIK